MKTNNERQKAFRSRIKKIENLKKRVKKWQIWYNNVQRCSNQWADKCHQRDKLISQLMETIRYQKQILKMTGVITDENTVNPRTCIQSGTESYNS